MPAFSFSKLRGMDAYLSPEMKSTGEAIGYDNKLAPRRCIRRFMASGMQLHNYGTVVVTLADEDKAEALPLIRRFYRHGLQHRSDDRYGGFPEGSMASVPESDASSARAAKRFWIPSARAMSAMSSTRAPCCPAFTMKTV